MIDLSGKIALVTGASRGIGAAVAKGLAASGAHVILLARTQGALEEVDDAIRAAGGKATLMKLDLRKFDDVDKLGPAVFEKFGGLDIFVGNAGVLGTLTPLHQMDPKEWQKVFDINVTANARLIRTLDPLLRASDAGRMIFTGSETAHRARAYWSAYRASKAALESMVKIYAQETEQTNMRVNIVYPGATQTDLLDQAYPGGCTGDVKAPDDVVDIYLELASSSCEKHGDIALAA
ncbi:MAG: short-chain dehydrogenase [Micavibrio sp.]|nr:MAG: short-chain dehydrogenase [Micavibrio sp.]